MGLDVMHAFHVVTPDTAGISGLLYKAPTRGMRVHGGGVATLLRNDRSSQGHGHVLNVLICKL